MVKIRSVFFSVFAKPAWKIGSVSLLFSLKSFWEGKIYSDVFFSRWKHEQYFRQNLHERKKNLHLKCTQCECVKSDIIKNKSLQPKSVNYLFKVKRRVKWKKYSSYLNDDPIDIGLCLGFKLSCNTLFTHAKNAWVFRASWAKPRLISITKVKMHHNVFVFWLEIFLFKIEITWGKKLKRLVVTSIQFFIRFYN